MVARTKASDVLLKGGVGPEVKLNQYSPIGTAIYLFVMYFVFFPLFYIKLVGVCASISSC